MILMKPFRLALLAVSWFVCSSLGSAAQPWTFVSMPDFLNVDTDYPQPGWEPAVDYILDAVKSEDPDFLLVAGDQVMGHWQDAEGIAKYAARYYSAWKERLRDHDLVYYAALGDHEIGDNPWRGAKADLVPLYKRAFREHLKMPLNGPEHMQGTAFWWKHKNVLFVSVDVFEKGESDQGSIRAGVTGRQLSWLDTVLSENGPTVDHLVVMGHTPVLGPVRKWSSSGLMLTGGRESPFWQTLKKHGVDLYLCGEVHAITCTERDGVQQIAHGGLIGYNTRTNYLVAHVYSDRVELELKEIDMLPSGEHLWQPGTNRPLESVTISQPVRQRGFTPVGRLTIDKRSGKKRFIAPQGYFLPQYESSNDFAVPVFRTPRAGTLQTLPRIGIENQ
jgi:hypothetical protein